MIESNYFFNNKINQVRLIEYIRPIDVQSLNEQEKA